MCNSQFSPWDMKHEKLVSDDNSEPSDPNQRSVDSPHCPLPDLTQLTCVHTHTYAHMHTCMHTHAPAPHPLPDLTLPIFLNLASVPPLWLHTAVQHFLPHRTPLSCLRDPMRPLPPGVPRLFPSSCHRSSRLSCPGPSPDPSPHHRQSDRLAIGEAIQGLADRAVLPVRTAAAKLEEEWFCEWGEGLLWLPPRHSLTPPCTPQLHCLLAMSACIWDWKYLG